MNAVLYILNDRNLTKVGITRQYAKRLKQHRASNPYIEEFKRYEMSIENAKRIERNVKLIFQEKKHLNSPEWFAISPDIVDVFVNGLIVLMLDFITEEPSKKTMLSHKPKLLLL